MEHLKIVTINTWKCDGDYAKRLPILASQLKALNPAIIACQECFVSDEIQADTLKYLAGELNMNYLFVAGRAKKRLVAGQWVDSQSGLGILSVYPLSDPKQFNLPPVPGDEDRKAQQAVVSLPQGIEILVTNTHLTHLKPVPDTRLKQAGALAAIVSADKTHRYRIVCGDFNATQDSTEIKAFLQWSDSIDCYTAGQGAEPRYSLADAFANNKLICVDHIFALPYSDREGYPTFVNSSVVLNTLNEASGLYPSDHFGISTTMLIP
jgi:endonuclease/exonuclease/phosphatase family metal-dependent hydrolase